MIANKNRVWWGVRASGVLLSVSLAACGPLPQQADQTDVTEKQSAVCSSTPPPTLADISKPTPGGVIHYTFVGTTDANCVDSVTSCISTRTCTCLRNRIRSAMKDWEVKTGTVTFVEDNPSTPRSYAIGLDAPGCFPNNQPWGCDFKHETGHMLGLAHEIQRADANRYLTLNLADDVCDDGSEGTRYTDTIWSGTNFGAYDEVSVMHYGPVLGKDSTYDFTRKDGTVKGLGGQPPPAGETAGSIVQPGDASNVNEHQAETKGWDRFRNRGTAATTTTPLVTQLATSVTLKSGKQLAAARLRRVDLSLVYGSDNHVYVSSRGTKASAWQSLFSSSTAIAATTVGTEFAIANATASAISVQFSTNASSQIAAHPDGAVSYAWSTPVSWGLPSTSSAVSSIATASLGTSKLAIVARLANNDLWLRQSTSLSSPNGTWTKISTGVVSRPAMAAFNGALRVYHAHTASSVTTLRESICTASCGAATDVTTVLAGAAAAVTASQTELHLLFKDPQGQFTWRRQDTAAAFTKIGGLVGAEPAVTNTFEDRYGSYSVFAELNDHNLWQRIYSRYFAGRMSNLPPNDYDRDAKTDFVYVRNGVWNVLPSSGMPSVSITLPSGSGADVLLPAADYDGDGASDLRVYRRATGMWSGVNVDRVTANTIGSQHSTPDLQFGTPTDRPVPADYDGDMVMDEAVFRPADGRWYLSLSSGAPDPAIPFGVATDRQVPGDYDGDGKADEALFRPSSGTWFVHPSGGGGDRVVVFGSATDRLVPADYDGDGRTDFAVFHPATGHWNIRFQNGDPDADIPFGVATDRLVPGDYDGDGITDLAVFRPSEGKWYIHPSTGAGDIVKTWGTATDALPWPSYTTTPVTVAGDFDGDNKADVRVFRRSTGFWWARLSGGGGDLGIQFGVDSDIVTPGDYDGDGRVDVSVYRIDSSTGIATWYARPSGGGADLATPFDSTTSGQPMAADYDGDGRTDFATFRPATGVWTALHSSGGPPSSINFGQDGDIPVPGDYDGDGKADFAVYRPSIVTWFAHLTSSGSDLVIPFGALGDTPLVGDFDGDGKVDPAVFRPSVNQWFYRPSGGGGDVGIDFGSAVSRVVPGDFDGDHKFDATYVRNLADGSIEWHTMPTTTGIEQITSFGVTTDSTPYAR